MLSNQVVRDSSATHRVLNEEGKVLAVISGVVLPDKTRNKISVRKKKRLNWPQSTYG